MIKQVFVALRDMLYWGNIDGRWKVGLDDLGGVFQTKKFYKILNHKQNPELLQCQLIS